MGSGTGESRDPDGRRRREGNGQCDGRGKALAAILIGLVGSDDKVLQQCEGGNRVLERGVSLGVGRGLADVFGPSVSRESGISRMRGSAMGAMRFMRTSLNGVGEWTEAASWRSRAASTAGRSAGTGIAGSRGYANARRHVTISLTMTAANGGLPKSIVRAIRKLAAHSSWC